VPRPIHDFLGRDHARIAVHLERARAPAGDLDLRAYAEFRALLFRHLALEERILIPAVLRASPRDIVGLFTPIRAEHAAIRAMLLPTPDAALADEVGSFLLAHERAESGPNGVYSVAEIVLARRAETIVEAMRAYPRAEPPPYENGPRSVRTARAALDAVLVATGQRT
jgi:hypothetical protein